MVIEAGGRSQEVLVKCFNVVLTILVLVVVYTPVAIFLPRVFL